MNGLLVADAAVRHGTWQVRTKQRSPLMSSFAFHPRLHPAVDAAVAAAAAGINNSDGDEIAVERATATGFVARLMRNINSESPGNGVCVFC